MQLTVNIAFEQLLEMVKTLPSKEKAKLLAELQQEHQPEKNNDLHSFLLNGPVFTRQQLNTIAETRKAINEWRKD
jgi:hypothetical protein